MQKFIRRVVWGSVWIATYAIIVYLCMELADGQPVMLALLLLAAFVASVGLVYSRQSFLGGDWTVGTAALFVTAIALAVSVIGDISYWSGTLESVHEQVTRDRAIHEGQNLVMKRQKERYSALSNGQSADRLQAEMAAALAKPISGKALGARTDNCTDTASPHYQACRPYFDLKAQFAAASEAQKLESVVWSAGTNVEKPGRRRDFYRAAVGIAEVTGWKVENSIFVITAVIVTLLQALLMLSLYIAVSPSRKEARGAAKLPQATPSPAIGSVAVVARPTPQPRQEYKPWVDLTTKPAPTDDTPPPADAKPVVEEVAAEHDRVATKMIIDDRHLPNHPRIVVNNDREGNDDFPEKYRGKKAKGPSAQSHARQAASVRKWVSLSNQVPDRKVCADSDSVWEGYSAWLEVSGEHGFAHRKPMIAEFGRIYFRGGHNGRTSRNAKGPKYPGFDPYHPKATPLRASA